MKRIVFGFLLLIGVVSLTGCGNAPNGGSAVYHKVTAQQAKAMMEDGDPYILVDVRTESEYQAQRIDGAILIPVDTIKDRAAAELPDKDARIFTYCRSGVRSSTAAHALVDLGYTHVNDMGGIMDWPYDTVSG